MYNRNASPTQYVWLIYSDGQQDIPNSPNPPIGIISLLPGMP